MRYIRVLDFHAHGRVNYYSGVCVLFWHILKHVNVSDTYLR